MMGLFNRFALNEQEKIEVQMTAWNIAYMDCHLKSAYRNALGSQDARFTVIAKIEGPRHSGSAFDPNLVHAQLKDQPSIPDWLGDSDMKETARLGCFTTIMLTYIFMLRYPQSNPGHIQRTVCNAMERSARRIMNLESEYALGMRDAELDKLIESRLRSHSEY